MMTTNVEAVYQTLVRLKHVEESAKERKRDKLQTLIGDYTLTQLHILSLIETEKRVNNRLLSERLGVTKAAISKAILKLLENQLLETYQLENNQKAIFYRLTDNGKKLSQKHLELHHLVKMHYLEFLAQFDEGVLGNVHYFMNQLIQYLDEA